MHRLNRFLIVLVCATPIQPLAAACNCGPDFCQDDPRVAPRLSSKKASLGADGYPDRLRNLLDKGGKCYAAIDRAPDIMTIWLIYPNGDKQTVPWSLDDEDKAKNQVTTGELKRFWIYNARHAFACCGEPNYDQRADYNEDDDLNTQQAIRCQSGDNC